MSSVLTYNEDIQHIDFMDIKEKKYLSYNGRTYNFRHVRLVIIQIRLRICAV